MKVTCNRDCNLCTKLNTKTDNLGYPFGYECLKYEDTISKHKFSDTKEFFIHEKQTTNNQM